MQKTVVAPLPPAERQRYPEVVPQRPVPPAVTQPEVKPRGPAASLYEKAKSYIADGDYTRAELTLERALRVEPKNGYYWYSLAEAKFGQKQFGKAVQFCLKSKSLAGADDELIRLNDRLMEKAR